MIFTTYELYEVPLRDVPKGGAQEQNNTSTRMKYLRTCLELHPRIINVRNAHIFFRTDYTTVCGISVGLLIYKRGVPESGY